MTRRHDVPTYKRDYGIGALLFLIGGIILYLWTNDQLAPYKAFLLTTERTRMLEILRYGAVVLATLGVAGFLLELVFFAKSRSEE